MVNSFQPSAFSLQLVNKLWLAPAVVFGIRREITTNFLDKIKIFLIDFVRFFYIAYTPNCIFPADYST